MGIWELFSVRQKNLENPAKTEIYQFTKLPMELRNQIIHILRSSIGLWSREQNWDGGYVDSPSNEMWTFIFETITRERGVFVLSDANKNLNIQCFDYIQRAETHEVLDLVEISFRFIDKVIRDMPRRQTAAAHITQSPDDAIAELNARFKQHGVGFQYEGGQLVKVSSQYLHSEVVRPAIQLLNDVGFDGAIQEFLSAHEHLRHNRNTEAIVEACKSFESTMKAICDVRKWKYKDNATANPLIETLMSNGLVPEELSSHFGGLRSAMQSGLPMIRNRQGGHGQGLQAREIPDHIAAFALHLAAANIVFLVQAHRAKK